MQAFLKKFSELKEKNFLKTGRLGIADFSRYDLMRSSTPLNDKKEEHWLNWKYMEHNKGNSPRREKSRKIFLSARKENKKKAVSPAYSYHFELKRGFEGLYFKLPSLSKNKKREKYLPIFYNSHSFPLLLWSFSIHGLLLSFSNIFSIVIFKSKTFFISSLEEFLKLI